MSLVPDINKVREMTAENDEKITQSFVEKYTKAVANGIWQEARSGKTEYIHMLMPDNVSFKMKALERVGEIYREAGYEVTYPQDGPIRGISIRFSWAKENH